jgi:arsenate reductase (thioredoxin)
MEKESVLFVCTHNSARSQMAEGLLRALHGDRFESFSAGTHPSRVNPFATAAMAEIGIDISEHRSESIDLYADRPIDHVVTVCDSARESCPYLPARKANIHKRFDDPSAVDGSDEEKLAAFRRVRDEIREWLQIHFGVARPAQPTSDSGAGRA